MDKPKRHSKNFFRHFLNEFILFRRDFSFEMNTNPETIVEKIQALSYEDAAKRTIVKLYELDEGWQFKLIAEQYAKGGFSQTAKAQGEILQEHHGRTLLKGEVTLGGVYYFFLVLMFIGMALYYYWTLSRDNNISESGFALTLVSLMLVFFLGVAVYVWWRMYRDRNNLFRLIQAVLEEEKDKNLEHG